MSSGSHVPSNLILRRALLQPCAARRRSAVARPASIGNLRVVSAEFGFVVVVAGGPGGKGGVKV